MCGRGWWVDVKPVETSAGTMHDGDEYVRADDLQVSIKEGECEGAKGHGDRTKPLGAR